MKKMKMIYVLFLIILFISSFFQTAYAGYKNYTCNVDQVGYRKNETTRVMLTHEGGIFIQKWFVCKFEVSKEMLAVLLTAIYGNMQVRIRADLEKSKQPEIKDLYIIAP